MCALLTSPYIRCVWQYKKLWALIILQGPSITPIKILSMVTGATVENVQAVLPIVKTFPQIETCMECSARKLQFVGEVFYYALRSVVHPMAPLYEPESQQLRPMCARALKRIFMLCDTDGDGILNDAELNAFQVRCFNAPLQPEELAGVKQVVEEKIPQGIDHGGLTLPGFLFLHALFIERGRLETTWAVLRRFGYANDLRLRNDVLAKAAVPHAPDQVVELTPMGRAFFQSAFDRFDVDDDGSLSAREREELFSTAPEDPWKAPPYQGVLVETTKKGLITLQGYLAMWSYTATLDPQAALAGALYLGLPEDAPLDRLLTVSKPRRSERRALDGPRRSILQCLVFSAPGVDASVVMDGLIAQARPTHGGRFGNPAIAVASVPLPMSSSSTPPREDSASAASDPEITPRSPNGDVSASSSTKGRPGHVTLIMRSVSPEQATAFVEQTNRQEDLQRYDVAVFAFDAAKPVTFSTAVEQMLEVATASGDVLPCVLLSLNNKNMAPSMEVDIAVAVTIFGLMNPVEFPDSLSTPEGAAELSRVYQRIVASARDPEGTLSIPETPSLKATKQHRRMLRKATLVIAGGTVAAVAGYFAYKVYKASQQHTSNHDASSAMNTK